MPTRAMYTAAKITTSPPGLISRPARVSFSVAGPTCRAVRLVLRRDVWAKGIHCWNGAFTVELIFHRFLGH